MMSALHSLPLAPDLVMVDGQGIAHPRRVGLASHLGLILKVPTIGCAKSLLCGEHEELAADAGSQAEIKDNGEVIGAVVRTKKAVKPVYVSIGNLINLDDAVSLVNKCCRGYRLPEPTRLAHLAAGGKLKAPASIEQSYNSLFKTQRVL